MLAQVLAKQAAREAGAQEAVMVDAQGMVTEGSSSTAWIVDADGVLRTRHLDNAVLPGCTRGSLLALIGEAGLVARNAPSRRGDARRARKVYHQRHRIREAGYFAGWRVGRRRNGRPGDAPLFELYARHVAAGANFRT